MIGGLTQIQNDIVLDEIRRFSTISRVVVFGSRAIGNYKPGSDVDLAIWGDLITSVDAKKLEIRLNEYTQLPYRFDVVAFDHLTEVELKEHVRQLGKEIYNSDNA